jgi:catechol 2,3-dioxygenase-like lactoylglutathione lyase family enzyme
LITLDAQLASVALAGPNLLPAVDYYTSVWGLSSFQVGAERAVFSTHNVPDRPVLSLRSSDHRRIDRVTMTVPSNDHLEALRRHVRLAGATVVDEALTGPQALGCIDPDGRLLWFSVDRDAGRVVDVTPERGLPTKLSHIVLSTPNLPATVTFYTDVLGYRISDWLEDYMVFLRAGREHHILALAAHPHATLHHLAFEVPTVDSYMRATGRMLRSGRPLVWGPGRHGPGNNTFSYFADPTGHVVEFTTDLVSIDDEDEWKPRVWLRTPEQSDVWGTAGPRQHDAFIGEPDPTPGAVVPDEPGTSDPA